VTVDEFGTIRHYGRYRGALVVWIQGAEGYDGLHVETPRGVQVWVRWCPPLVLREGAQ
jgi:hypothetical protein